MITILDYGAGNVRSVINAIEKIGASVHVATGPADIERAEKLVFPGVDAIWRKAHLGRILGSSLKLRPCDFRHSVHSGQVLGSQSWLIPAGTDIVNMQWLSG